MVPLSNTDEGKIHMHKLYQLIADGNEVRPYLVGEYPTAYEAEGAKKHAPVIGVRAGWCISSNQKQEFDSSRPLKIACL
jgi:hypothetical protein